eukprot:7056896-Prymnesium_polylepis.1
MPELRRGHRGRQEPASGVGGREAVSVRLIGKRVRFLGAIASRVRVARVARSGAKTITFWRVWRARGASGAPSASGLSGAPGASGASGAPG